MIPSSGIVIQDNAFDNDNPPAGGASSEPNIWLDGQNSAFTAANGVQHISVQWNTFFNNCAAIRAVRLPRLGWALRGYLGERLQQLSDLVE